MASGCQQCSALQDRLAAAYAEIQYLRRQVTYLTDKLGTLLGGVKSLLKWLTAQIEEPTVSRQRVIPTVVGRLEMMRDEAEARRR